MNLLRIRILATTLIVFVIVFGTVLIHYVDATTDPVQEAVSDAVTYLSKESPPSEWTIMAMRAADAYNNLDVSSIDTVLENFSGTLSTDYAKRILAIVASGNDPRTYISQHNLIAEFEDQFFDGTQIGNTQQLNDDVWALLALRSAGIVSSDLILVATEKYIRQYQHTDGGWGYGTGSAVESDVDSTAATIMALSSMGMSSQDTIIQSAFSYLHSQQNSDGGFRGYGSTESNTDSTSWTLLALNAFQQSLTTWIPNTYSPIDYLLAQQQSDGSFTWKSNSTTHANAAFALIALTGKTIPVQTLPTTSPLVTFRIEGSASTICRGTVNAETVMDVVINAKKQCLYTYELAYNDTYLQKLNTDEASGDVGWLYVVNWKSGTSSATEAHVQENDDVVWYYGVYDWTPLKLATNTTNVEPDQIITATVQTLVHDDWQLVVGATIKVSDEIFVTDNNGKVDITLSSAGVTSLVAEHAGTIRSNTMDISFGSATNGISLHVDILLPRTPTTTPTLAIELSGGEIDFGELQPGGDATPATITLENSGDVDAFLNAEVDGDAVFTEGLVLDNASWQLFAQTLVVKAQTDVRVGLHVPQTTTTEGDHTGELIFWATEQQ